MLNFYHAPWSRGSSIFWLLEELGVPYEMKLVGIRAPGGVPEEYRSIQPNKKVPAIVHDGTVVTERAAIALYLTETFPRRALRRSRATRTRARVSVLARLFRLCFRPGARRQDAWLGLCAEPFLLRLLTTTWCGISKRRCPRGPTSPATVSPPPTRRSAPASSYASNVLGQLTDRPVFKDYLDRLTERPAYQRFMAKEKISSWQAAWAGGIAADKGSGRFRASRPYFSSSSRSR